MGYTSFHSTSFALKAGRATAGKDLDKAFWPNPIASEIVMELIVFFYES